MCWKVDAEQAQARERTGHRLRVFSPHDMQLDRQVVGSRLVNFRCASMQQLHNQLLAFFKVTAQKFALRAFEPQAERQRVVPSPVFVVEQVHAGR